MAASAATFSAPAQPSWPAFPLEVLFRCCVSAWSPGLTSSQLRLVVLDETASTAATTLQLIDVTSSQPVAVCCITDAPPSSGKRRRGRSSVAAASLERSLFTLLRARAVLLLEAAHATPLPPDDDSIVWVRVTIIIGLAPACLPREADAGVDFPHLRCLLNAHATQLKSHVYVPQPPPVSGESVNLYDVIDTLHAHECAEVALDARVTALHLCTVHREACSSRGGGAGPTCTSGKHLYAYQRQAVNWMLSREREEATVVTPVSHAHDVLWTPLSLVMRGGDGAWERDTRAHYYWNVFTGALVCDVVNGGQDEEMAPPNREMGLWHAPQYSHVSVGDGGVRGGFLCDDMGLGKTVEMLSLVAVHPLRAHGADAVFAAAARVVDGVDADMHAAWTALRTYSSAAAAAAPKQNKFASRATLVCVPVNLRAQWHDECAAWLPHLRVHVYDGIHELTKRARRPGYSMLTQAVIQREFLRIACADVVLVCEDTLAREWTYVTGFGSRVDGLEAWFYVPSRHAVGAGHHHARSPLEAFHFHRVAVDESQQLLRSHTHAAASMLLSLSRTFSWCISGTPAPTHHDLYPCLAFLGHAPFSRHKWYTDILTQALDGGDADDDVSSVRRTGREITLARMRAHGDSARATLSKLLSPILWRATRASVSSTIALPPAYVLVVSHEAALAEREAARTFTRAAVAHALKAQHRGAANAVALCEAALDGLVKSAVHPDMIPGPGRGAAGKQGQTGTDMQSVMHSLCSEAHVAETNAQLELTRALTELGGMYEQLHAHAHTCVHASWDARSACASQLCMAHECYTRGWSITDAVDVHRDTFMETSAALKPWVLADISLLTALSRVCRAVGDTAGASNAVDVLNRDSVRPFLRMRLHMQLAVSVYECALACARFWRVNVDVDETEETVASEERVAHIIATVSGNACDHDAGEAHVGMCALLQVCADRLKLCTWPLTSQLPAPVAYVPALTQTYAYNVNDDLGIAAAFSNVDMAAVEAAEGSMQRVGDATRWPSMTLLQHGAAEGPFDAAFQAQLTGAVSSGDRLLAAMNRFYAWALSRAQLDACERLRDAAAHPSFHAHAAVLRGVQTAGAEPVPLLVTVHLATWLQDAVSDKIRSLTAMCADISGVIHGTLVEHGDKWLDTQDGDTPARAIADGSRYEAPRRLPRTAGAHNRWACPRTSVWMSPAVCLAARNRVIRRIHVLELICEAGRMYNNVCDRERDIQAFWADAVRAYDRASAPVAMAACSSSQACSLHTAELVGKATVMQGRVTALENAAAEAARDHVWKRRVLAITDGSAAEDEELVTCLVCHDHLAGDAMLTVTRCGHAYHAECLTAWLKLSSSSKCPTCRAVISASQLWHVHSHACGREVGMTTLDEHVQRGSGGGSEVEHVPTRIPRPDEVNRLCEDDSRLSASMGTRIRCVCARVLAAFAAGERVCLVSSHTATLARVRHALNSLGVRAEQLTGTSAERAHVVHRFTADPVHTEAPIAALCMHTSTDTSGLTLTSANHIFLLDVTAITSRTHLSQLIGRIARHGQTRDCFVYVMLAVDSVEERILALRAGTLTHMGYVSSASRGVLRGAPSASRRFKRAKDAEGEDASRAYMLTRVGLHMSLQEGVDVLHDACAREGVSLEEAEEQEQEELPPEQPCVVDTGERGDVGARGGVDAAGADADGMASDNVDADY